MCAEQTCTCEEKHQGHMCVLNSRGLTQEMKALSDAPTVVCFVCGREANSPDNVCSSMPIEQ